MFVYKIVFAFLFPYLLWFFVVVVVIFAVWCHKIHFFCFVFHFSISSLAAQINLCARTNASFLHFTTKNVGGINILKFIKEKIRQMTMVAIIVILY